MWLAVLVGLLMLLGWLSSRCGASDDQVAEQSSAAGVVARPVPTAVAARRELATLRAVDRWPRGLPAYRRAAFGEPWRDVDGNGCDQRDDVLLRDALRARPRRQGACDHDVVAGTWRDPYTGRLLVLADLEDPGQAETVQIDHVVPLAEAWRSGASGWSAGRRERYANDLAGLLAVAGDANTVKGAGDPAGWRPRAAFGCSYARRWIDIKARWRLGADVAERHALAEMLDSCGKARGRVWQRHDA